MTSFNGIPVISLAASVNGAIASYGTTLPWNGVGKYYQWSLTFTVTTQSTSGVNTRQKFTYNGLDVNVGMWIANSSTGLAWQIVSITSKTSTTVTCVVQDIFRYNTYRDTTKTGNGKPPTGSYVVFELSEAGLPLIDPPPSNVSSTFLSTVISRFQYINLQNDFILNQPNLSTVTFQYGDVIAINPSTGFFVLADGTYLNVVGTCTAVDDSGVYFTIDAIQKINDQLNSLPGTVGNLIYNDPSNPGKLTTTPGGTEVYLQIRSQTASNTNSTVTVATPSTVITTVGYTFNVNFTLATIAGTGTLTDVMNAINAISSTTGVSATIAGSSGAYYLAIVAVDARAIDFYDVAGSTVEDAGLISVENGVKAAGMFITNSREQASFQSVIGFTYTQVLPATTWTVNHNGNTANYIAQVFDTSGNVILPDVILTTSVNTVTITFADGQTGTAQLSLFVPQPV
jgi:hypothetical protein